MGTTFKNSEKSKTSDSHWLLLNVLHKILKRSDNYVALSNLSIY